MNYLKTKTLAQIVNADHRAAAVFEKYHLDFCCKGKRSLQDACAENDLEVDTILADLSTNSGIGIATPSTDFNQFRLSQLADYIVATHHAYLKKEMPALDMYLKKVASKHGDRHPEMVKTAALFAAVKEEMEQHMEKEEVVLFPRIKEIEKHVAEGNPLHLNIAYVKSPVSMMEHEHDHAGNAMEEIRNLTNNYAPPADACTTFKLCLASLRTFEFDLHQHVHLENNILFPKALKLFDPPQSCSLN